MEMRARHLLHRGYGDIKALSSDWKDGGQMQQLAAFVSPQSPSNQSVLLRSLHKGSSGARVWRSNAKHQHHLLVVAMAILLFLRLLEIHQSITNSNF